MCLLVLALAVVGILVSAAPAGASTLRFSARQQVDFGGGVSLNAVYCRANQDCFALGADGRLLMFNPQQFEPSIEPDDLATAHFAIDAPGTPVAMSCVNGECIVVDDRGNESTIELGHPYPPFRYQRVDPAVTPSATPALDCVSATRCVLADHAGDLISFNPAHPATATHAKFAADQTGGLVDVSCATTAQCTAISATDEWTFDPDQPASATTAAIDTAPAAATALTCSSATQCTAVDDSGQETTFDPQTASTAPPVTHPVEAGARFTHVICPTDGRCVGSDAGNRLVTFTPASGARTSSMLVPEVQAMTCAGTTTCLAVEGDGGVFPFPGDADGSSGQEILDGGSPLIGVSCPTAGQCFAADATGEVLFSPGEPHARSDGDYDLPGSGAITGHACAQSTLCTVVRGDEEVSFDPHHIKHLVPRVVDHDGTAAFTTVRCPGASECVAGDTNGVAVAYDPADGHVLRSQINVARGDALTALACPSTSQCTATDVNGHAISFDPVNGRRALDLGIDPGVGKETASSDQVDAIACAATSSCLAVDTLGRAIHFDPRSQTGISARSVDAAAGLSGVACPSAGFCVLTSPDGSVFTGGPTASRWTSQRPPEMAALDGVTCRSTTDCVVTDLGGGESSSVGGSRSASVTAR